MKTLTEVLLVLFVALVTANGANAASPFAPSKERTLDDVVAMFAACEAGRTCVLNEPVDKYKTRLEREFNVLVPPNQPLSQLFASAKVKPCHEVVGQGEYPWYALDRKTGSTVPGPPRTCRDNELVFMLPGDERAEGTSMVPVSSDCLNPGHVVFAERAEKQPIFATMWCRKNANQTAPFNGAVFVDCKY